MLGKTEQQMDLRSKVTGAYARVVSTIELAMEAVPLGIVELATRLAVVARGSQVAGEQTGRPGAVVRLEPQFVVGVVRGQVLQPVR